MSTLTLTRFMRWEPIGPGRKRTLCPRCGTAIELRLMDDILEVACPGCGCGPFFERAHDFEAENGTAATRGALVELGFVTDEELMQADEVAGSPEEGANADQLDIVGAARALGFFQKSLFLGHHRDEGSAGEFAVRPLRELVSSQQLLEAVRIERQEGSPVGEVVADLALSAEKEKLRADLGEGEQLDLDSVEIDPHLRELVPAGVASSFLAIPVGDEDGTLVVAMLDPLDFHVIDNLKFQVGREIKGVQASEAALFRTLERVYAPDPGAEGDGTPLEAPLGDPLGDDLAHGLLGDEDELIEAEEAPPDMPGNAPGERTLNALLLKAAEERAEKVVLEPLEVHYRVRIQRGGRLRDAARLARDVGEAVIQRAMVQAGMDAGQIGHPQRGRLRLALAGDALEMEVATAPAALGLTMAMTMREASFRLLPLEGLALVPGDSMLLREVGRPEAGLTIIAGPPGSGRTTVFYAMLREADRAGEHVVALERRTRAHVEGTTQIVSNAYDEFGPTLERLRPDRVFFDDIAGDVGTVRPEEARLAIDLALTGVQVVVTVAAPTPTAALGRLAAAGIDLSVLRSVLRNVVGIRLVQRVCQRCREDFEVEPTVLTELGLGEEASRRIAIGIGCWECGGRGYRGNSALVEVLPLADPIMAEALCSLDSAAFEGAAREAGHRLLAEKAHAALRAGLTSPTQVSSLLPGTAAS